jgi:hypothetical protein
MLRVMTQYADPNIRSKMCKRNSLFASLILISLAAGLISCASSDPNIGRVLTSVSVTPLTADAQNFPNGQVVFTASGIYSLPPSPGPLTFVAPYSGEFTVDNPTNPPSTIATVVTTGVNTVTVQCVPGASGSVYVTASAAANNGSPTVVSGSGLLTCP